MFRKIAIIIRERDRYLAQLIDNVEDMIYIDSYSVILKGRSIAERVARNIIVEERLKEQDEISQKERVYILEKEGLLDVEIAKAFHTIRVFGNKVIHEEVEGAFETELTIYRNLHKILSWYVTAYVDSGFETEEYIEPNIIRRIRDAESQSYNVMHLLMNKLLSNVVIDGKSFDVASKFKNYYDIERYELWYH